MKSIVINLFAGPSTGKSVTAAKVFADLKVSGENAELVTEFAKELVYDNASAHQFEDQLNIVARQNQRQFRLHKAGVPYIVTDSPILLSLVYAKENYFKNFKPFIKEIYDDYNNLNIFLKRSTFPFQKEGRVHDEEQSIEIDNKIIKLLNDYNMDYHIVDAGETAAKDIIALAMKYRRKI